MNGKEKRENETKWQDRLVAEKHRNVGDGLESKFGRERALAQGPERRREGGGLPTGLLPMYGQWSAAGLTQKAVGKETWLTQAASLSTFARCKSTSTSSCLCLSSCGLF